MKQICQICDKEIELGERFVQKTSYTRHDKNDERPLWTEVNIVGREESFFFSYTIKPLCKKCAIKILENTIKTLRGDE